MIIKKFVAETMNEALAEVKRELGEDAVILQSRKLDKSSLLSLGGKSVVEVTAATPDRHPPPPREAKPVLNDEMKRSLQMGLGAAETRPLGTRRYSPDANRPDAGMPKPPETGKREGAGTQVKEMEKEIRDLRKTVEDLATHLKSKDHPEVPPVLKRAWQDLVDNDVPRATATDLIIELSELLTPEQIPDEDLVESRLHDLIAERFRIVKQDAGTDGAASRPRVVALIGPTGVGKTTTLAKLATNKKLYGEMDVAMISTDTYRVAAVEQLKTFASIAGLPMEVVYRPEELQRAIDKHKKRDIVLIDTAGRSQNDGDAIEELKAFMNGASIDEVVLVVAANTRLGDQEQVIERFAGVPANRVIITKVDEVSTAGHLIEMARLLPRGWQYLTTGQNVPDDIIAADELLVAAMVARKTYFEQLRANAFRLPTAAV